MRFDIITLFPELFTPFTQSGIIRRAFEAQGGQPPAVELHFTNPRDFADGNYRRVDDRPFGGGPGMLMMAEPLARAVEAVQSERANQGLSAAPVILFSPIGAALVHARIERLAQAGAHNPGAILICGRYEGIDQRFIDQFVTEHISMGDFVLSGGEIAAIALIDAVARLQPGVLGDDQSHLQDSFNPSIGGLLDCPHYTRPEVWRGQGVPPVLLSGNHADIEKWRQGQRQQITQNLRPELLDKSQKNRL
jgi:tRNA (guanine37-N1)-methyltransferase